MKKYILIKADTNDADYVMEKHEITDEQLKELEPIFKAIKECKISHNWATGEYCDKEDTPENVYKGILTEEQILLFEEYTPYGEYGIHTIESIDVLTVTEERNIL